MGKIRQRSLIGSLLRDYRNAYRVSQSPLFDAEWYWERYGDVREKRLNASLHYVQTGWKEGRDPGPNFSTRAYLSAFNAPPQIGLKLLLQFFRSGQPAQEQAPGSNQSNSITCKSPPAAYERVQPKRHKPSNKRRVAIFASYSENGQVSPYVEYYLKHLSLVSDAIIFVADNGCSVQELAKIKSYVAHAICERHGEYDFGSYKRGLMFARDAGILAEADEVILCNDSCYGPCGGFENLFQVMDAKKCDFWGVTANTQFEYHLQSYFVVFRKPVFSHASFWEFFRRVTKQTDVSSVVLTYEVPMTRYFHEQGFLSACLISHENPNAEPAAKETPNLTVRPGLLLDLGCPLIKVKAFRNTCCNVDGIEDFVSRLREEHAEVYGHILEHASPTKFLTAPSVRFSIIMPFHNRIGSLPAAIDSALAQKHQNFELVLIDDGSDDGSTELVQSRYRRELETGKIVLLRLRGRHGVSAARNVGLEVSRSQWIAYLDSDNQIRPTFLSVFASSIVEHPNHKLFYSNFMSLSDGKVQGRKFNRADLLKANFIDLGVFVHSRDLFIQYGGFDTSLKRLVDWDLIIRFTAENVPVYIPAVFLDYRDDKSDSSRVSVKESLDDARLQLRRKHNLSFSITTIIPTYNHEKYIDQAINSALAQQGSFIHEIIICDDGSTDNTRDIVGSYARENNGLIVDLSSPTNGGISKTFRRCIDAASGDFVAILEGDDYWTDKHKLEKQLQFLVENAECSMVFSRIAVLNAGKTRLLERQAHLTSKLTGRDFLDHSTMNLIANFSSCLFRSGLLRSAPYRLFQDRFNEIALAFYLERHGKIGYLNEVLSTYRQHPNGAWTGIGKRTQLESAIATREMVKDVADPIYAREIQTVIDAKKRELALVESAEKSSAYI